jgi:hypothetical protein
MLQHAQPGAQLVAVVALVGKLKQWQQQLQQTGATADQGKTATTTAASAAAAAAAASDKGGGNEVLSRVQKEFGADLDFKLDAGVERGWLAAVFTPSATGVTRVTPAGQALGGPGVTPGEMRQMFMEDTKQAGAGTAAAGGGGGRFGGVDDAVDIDSDDEKKGKGKKVRRVQTKELDYRCDKHKHKKQTGLTHAAVGPVRPGREKKARAVASLIVRCGCTRGS